MVVQGRRHGSNPGFHLAIGDGFAMKMDGWLFRIKAGVGADPAINSLVATHGCCYALNRRIVGFAGLIKRRLADHVHAQFSCPGQHQGTTAAVAIEALEVQ